MVDVVDGVDQGLARADTNGHGTGRCGGEIKLHGLALVEGNADVLPDEDGRLVLAVPLPLAQLLGGLFLVLPTPLEQPNVHHVFPEFHGFCVLSISLPFDAVLPEGEPAGSYLAPGPRSLARGLREPGPADRCLHRERRCRAALVSIALRIKFQRSLGASILFWRSAIPLPLMTSPMAAAVSATRCWNSGWRFHLSMHCRVTSTWFAISSLVGSS